MVKPKAAWCETAHVDTNPLNANQFGSPLQLMALRNSTRLATVQNSQPNRIRPNCPSGGLQVIEAEIPMEQPHGFPSQVHLLSLFHMLR